MSDLKATDPKDRALIIACSFVTATVIGRLLAGEIGPEDESMRQVVAMMKALKEAFPDEDWKSTADLLKEVPEES